ncbi:uncharacterized protein LOC132195987 [Neocloeon triangulifer]|uniref:uncharacterized protein LOC132195987 n=1 Tax=Neocloeon triangulifer TaxID=2078957 RepID=UPI00286F9517|nr:uncharacterized protein LOC132195987 [Neocloeon triangulifer]
METLHVSGDLVDVYPDERFTIFFNPNHSMIIHGFEVLLCVEDPSKRLRNDEESIDGDGPSTTVPSHANPYFLYPYIRLDSNERHHCHHAQSMAQKYGVHH